MSSPKILFGFHALTVRLKTQPDSIVEIHFDASRRDARMRGFKERVQEAGVRLIESDDERLGRLAGSPRHQGVVARVNPVALTHSLDEVLEGVEAAGAVPLVLVLDGVTDPHNLGACLRVADGAGAQAVVAPKDHAVGVNATVAKVASGAAETVPYLMVTNLARSLGELKERDIWVVGTSDRAERSIYDIDLNRPIALVLGAEGQGLRALTAKTCDELVSIPMQGAVESLNVSVAAGVCLYEVLRQRRSPARAAPAEAREAPLGLLDRVGLYEQAQALWGLAQRRMRPISVVRLCVDDFEAIRDDRGPAAGELVEERVAALLKQTLRAADFVASWGGATFVLVLPETDEHEAAALAGRLRADIAALQFGEGSDRIAITASFGVVQRHDQPTLEQLVHDADHWLAEASAAGGDRVLAPPQPAFPDLTHHGALDAGEHG
ncbi:MAG: 23S rRNA (guanosine(2251)-2'-O)-methyltransferase RlmB [Paucibacter sp.]|nr:23S rRNA (guanosine(2251)-2'-O)-methyltransferase RlmB [Roseateles sp.]